MYFCKPVKCILYIGDDAMTRNVVLIIGPLLGNPLANGGFPLKANNEEFDVCFGVGRNKPSHWKSSQATGDLSGITVVSTGLLYVVDSSDRERIGDSHEELEGILGNGEMKGVPFVVLANKQDMQNAMSSLELIEELGLRKYNGRHEWHVHATCAVTGEGIFEAMDGIGRLIKQRKVWPQHVNLACWVREDVDVHS